MLKTRFFKPHANTPNNVWKPLKFTMGRAGVYIIAEKGEWKYIGYSETDLYKTLTRHFQSWEDNSQLRVTFDRYEDITVRIIITTPAKAYKLERALILKHSPIDNPDKLKGRKISLGEANALLEYEALTPMTKEEVLIAEYGSLDTPF